MAPEFRARRFRDLASMVSLIGPICMGLGIVATWSILKYRVDELEKNITSNRSDIQAIQIELAKRGEKIDEFDRRINECCIIYRRGLR